MNNQLLKEIRVLDLGTVWAAPICAKLLAFAGAEVIHIEPYNRPDPIRFGDYSDNETRKDFFWETGGRYHSTNSSKLGLGLLLDNPEGLKWFKELVKISDVVIENYSPGVTSKLGIDYNYLSEIKSDIIMVSISAFGQTGPWAKYKGYGPVTEAASGVPCLSGHPDGPPVLSTIALADPPSSLMAYFAIVSALYYRHRTGKGQHIELSQHEVLTHWLGEAILDYTVNKRRQNRMGNRHRSIAPHGVYRCKGNDKWISIAVSSDKEWKGLCEAMGDPHWTKEEKFSNNFNRYQNQGELDKLIEEWTINKEHYEALHLLQDKGVPSGAVLNSKEILLDPHLRERGSFQLVDYSEARKGLNVGKRWHLSLPWRPREKVEVKPAPKLGEHNREIFEKLLGVEEEKVRELVDKGILGDAPPKEIRDAPGMLGVTSLCHQKEEGRIIDYDLDYKDILGMG